MKKARRLVVLILLLSLFCLAFEAGAQGRKVRVCTPGAGTGSMHIYAAKDRGYFLQESLDVDVLVTRGQICTMALINGQMELTTNPNVFDAMVAGKFQGKVIYVTAKTLGHRFIAAPDIKSFNDLKGKTIAISTFGGLTDMLTREILEQHGIRPHKDVALLQLGTPDLRYGALKAGTVKAALVSSTQALTGLRDGFRELRYEQPPWLSSPNGRRKKARDPVEYFQAGRVFVTCEADEDINSVAGLIGENSFVLGSDYPHGDPSRQEDMVAEFRERKDLSPRMVEKMLSDNPRRLYGL